MKITKKTILLEILIYLFLCLTYYIFMPKYTFLFIPLDYNTSPPAIGGIIRFNKITGKTEIWNGIEKKWRILK